MRKRASILVLAVLSLSAVAILPAQAQQTSTLPSGNDTVEGAVVSSTRSTLVVRTDDNQFQLFTYANGGVRPRTLAAGSRVRVAAGAADENGTREATNVAVVSAASNAGGVDKGAQAAPVPEKVHDVESQIRKESRRWRLGVHAGAAFNPELFSFGVQSQMGPIFHPRVLFRPNAEFAYGEVTDLVALNLEGIYRFSQGCEREIGRLTSGLDQH
jgi:hypothetical protein